ncbi:MULTISPECIES: LexA family transcriptional regulator [unclassified Flavobacterium]|uniref:XRE family transcriptional regulator n=1 Tax=unclassified Flavobacterium TaxID=196869 RepID=UPI001F12BD12|nr:MULTISPECIES: LexA family transcriptional regulator [unclassified Flavobacterium]UMY64956.1 LexA family transcriptional regulator [Flavobacterium sp. HJ-32-4]
MAEQIFFWGSNIRFLRNRMKMSQEDFAAKLSISRSKLAAHESGKTANPPVEDLYRFSGFFRMSIDTLLRVDLSRIGELKLRELEAGNDVYIAGGQIRVLAITVDRQNRENMEYVPVKAKAGYAAGYHDPEFIASLPKFALPNLPKGGTFRMFPTTGDSMLPIPENSDVIGRFVDNWYELKPKTLCIVILKGEQDMVFKQVTLTGRTFLLESLNPLYAPYEVKAEEVVEIWKFHSFHSKDLPNGTADLDVVVRMMQEMKGELQELKAGLGG